MFCAIDGITINYLVLSKNMPYNRAREILKNPNASAANLLKAYANMNMEFGRYTANPRSQKVNDEGEEEGELEADLDFRYMVVIQALELRIHQKFRRGA